MKEIFNIFLRYVLILVAGIFGMSYIYKLLSFITINTLGAVFSIFHKVIISGDTIYLEKIAVKIIPSCVAGSAFYLVFFLIFSCFGIKPLKRMIILFTAFASIFLFNILRILFLYSISGTSYFDTTHWIFWNFFSTIFIVALWIAIVHIYKIKSIPFYTDIKHVYKIL